MNKRKSKLLAIAVTIVLVSSGVTAYFVLTAGNKQPSSGAIRVACVGDSLTQSTFYPYDLGLLLGTANYTVRNFGAGSTTVLLNTETPYMNTSVFQDALEFLPNIVIIMLGTNDAQPNLHEYNASFVADYVTLINAFQLLSKAKNMDCTATADFQQPIRKNKPRIFQAHSNCRHRTGGKRD